MAKAKAKKGGRGFSAKVGGKRFVCVPSGTLKSTLKKAKASCRPGGGKRRKAKVKAATASWVTPRSVRWS
jgi:hypothetical protein